MRKKSLLNDKNILDTAASRSLIIFPEGIINVLWLLKNHATKWWAPSGEVQECYDVPRMSLGDIFLIETLKPYGQFSVKNSQLLFSCWDSNPSHRNDRILSVADMPWKSGLFFFFLINKAVWWATCFRMTQVLSANVSLTHSPTQLLSFTF